MRVCDVQLTDQVAAAMSALPSPLKPPPRDINRIVRLRDELGAENLYDALFPLLSGDKAPTVRALASALHTSPSTAWKMKHSLPLCDITNLSHAEMRATLRAAVESPQLVVVPSVHPAPHQYLTNIELEALVQLVDARAHNKQAIGMSAIRQYAADLRAQRLKKERVQLPSRSWYYQFERAWLKDFRRLTPTPREFKRANAERAPEIERFFEGLKRVYDEYRYPPDCIWAADETGLEGDAASREKVQVPKTLGCGVQVKGSFRDHVSAMHMCNAAGVNLPPIFSFIGTWFNPELLDGAPEGSKTAMHENGYFVQGHVKGFIQHIVDYMEGHPEVYYEDGDITNPRRQCLLILDGATTHVSGAGWEYAREQRIDITFLPPNLTHLMQVLTPLPAQRRSRS
jgi:hypothetical protein